MVETLKSSIQSKRQNIIWHKIWFLFIKTSFYTGIRQRNRKQWQFHWTIAISCGLMSQVTHLNYPCQSPHSNIPVLSNIPQSPSMPFWSFYHKYIFKKGWRSTPTLPTAVFSNFNKQLRIVKCPKFQHPWVLEPFPAWGQLCIVSSKRTLRKEAHGAKGYLMGWRRDQLNVHCWKRSAVLHWSIIMLVPLSRKHWPLPGFFRRFPWKEEADKVWLNTDPDRPQT